MARRRTHGEPHAPDALVCDIRARSLSLTDARDLDPLLERIGDARCVLLGEASHGTHEYYTWRAAISQRLIEEKGFSFIAVEGDWPDCYRVNRYVKGCRGLRRRMPARCCTPSSAGRPGCGPTRRSSSWPTGCVGTTTAWPEERQVGFYGLDVYSLWDSLVRGHGLPAQARRGRRWRPPGGPSVLRAVRRGRAGVRPGHALWWPSRARTRSSPCSGPAARRRRRDPRRRPGGATSPPSRTPWW